MSKAGARVPGTLREGDRTEVESSRAVREMFTRIAPRYDFLNHLLSLSLDRVWRRRTASCFRNILRRPGARVLDLCSGTGDLALAFERARGETRGATILGADFSSAMLERAQRKARRDQGACVFFAADALALPFADDSLDLVAAAFGFRNLADYESGLREIARVLRPGGEVGILEFSEPRGWPFAPIYRFYFTRILPRLGGAISGSAAAYSYLPDSVWKFPSPEELAELMAGAGFRGVRFAVWTFGVVTLHRGRKS